MVYRIHFRKLEGYLLISSLLRSFDFFPNSIWLSCPWSPASPKQSWKVFRFCFCLFACLSAWVHYDKMLSVSFSHMLLKFVSFFPSCPLKIWASRAVFCNHKWILGSLGEIKKMTYVDFSPYTNGIKTSGSDGSICIYIYIFQVPQWTAKVRSIMEWHVSFVCF